MTESPEELAASDEIVSALAERLTPPQVAVDPLARDLASWVVHLERRALRELDEEPADQALRYRALRLAVSSEDRGHARRRVARRAVSLTAVLTISSTGLAAAVTGDAWPSDRLMHKIARFSHALTSDTPSRGEGRTRINGGRTGSVRSLAGLEPGGAWRPGSAVRNQRWGPAATASVPNGHADAAIAVTPVR
jgi:hypothetical protein